MLFLVCKLAMLPPCTHLYMSSSSSSSAYSWSPAPKRSALRSLLTCISAQDGIKVWGGERSKRREYGTCWRNQSASPCPRAARRHKKFWMQEVGQGSRAWWGKTAREIWSVRAERGKLTYDVDNLVDAWNNEEKEENTHNSQNPRGEFYAQES